MLSYLRPGILLTISAVFLLLTSGTCSNRPAGEIRISEYVEEERSQVIETDDTLTICSFNIQFLGHFKNREDSILAEILSPYDMVVVQELVAPPISGTFPDGSNYSADLESASFVNAMAAKGFAYWLSEEDTGPTKNHVNSSASEWWIVFYKGEKVMADSARAFGFLSDTLVANGKFDRVPYAFPFKSKTGKADFTLISVHLQPGNSVKNRARRQVELSGIFDWISAVDEENEDFLILGDCNIYKPEEFTHFAAHNYQSLNHDCHSTNTKLYESATKGMPYDHVFYSDKSIEDLIPESFRIIDLMELIKSHYLEGEFPYLPYNHDKFRTAFSDHLPIIFEMLTTKDSD